MTLTTTRNYKFLSKPVSICQLYCFDRNMSEVSSYTVESLLERLALTEQQKIWEHYPDNIQVQGTVENVNVWKNKHAYVTLAGSGFRLTLRCPPELRPSEGEHIVFRGQVMLKPNRLNIAGLDVHVIGEPIGQWEPKDEAGGSITIERGPRILLSQYLKQNQLSELLIVGTKTGLNDMASCLNGVQPAPVTKEVRVHDADCFLEDLSAVYNPQAVSGLGVVRGGDDASLNIWDDAHFISKLVEFNIPLYLALGHSHRVLLADKYADEIFHTPTGFGASLSQQHATISEVENYKHQLQETRRQAHEYERNADKLRIEASIEAESYKRRTEQLEQVVNGMKQGEERLRRKIQETQHRPVKGASIGSKIGYIVAGMLLAGGIYGLFAAGVISLPELPR